MSLFGDKDANVEEISRNNRIKKAITKQLATVLKSLQKEYGGAGPDSPSTSQQPIYSGDLPSHLCLCVEAVFLHGLKKARFRKKWSGYFGGDGGTGSDGDPQSFSFWPFVIKFTHKDTVAQLKRSQHLKCEVGLCRAWVRTALNEGLVESYLSAMLADSGSTAQHYAPVAYLRDTEQPAILMGLLRGLCELTFALSYNMPSLNVWTTAALAIAGVVESGSSPATLVAVGASRRPSPPSYDGAVGSGGGGVVVQRAATAAAAVSASLPAFGGPGSSGMDNSAIGSRYQPVSRPREDSGDGSSGAPSARHPTSGVRHAAEETAAAGGGDGGGSGRNDDSSADDALGIAVAGAGGGSSAGAGDVSTAETSSASAPEASARSRELARALGGSALPSRRSGEYEDDDDGSPSPLISLSSAGRRNPFLLSSGVVQQAAADEPAAAGSAGAARLRGKSASADATDNDTSSRYSYGDDENDSGLATATLTATTATWTAVPRPMLEPVTGNSLGSLSGWASALSPADVADEPAAAAGGIDQSEPDSAARGAWSGASGGNPLPPGGSPEYAASFDELMRKYRPGWSAASVHQVSSSSDASLPQQQQQQRTSALPDPSDAVRGPGSGSSSSDGSGLAKSEDPQVAAVATSAPLDRQSPDSDYEVLDPYDGLAEDVGECYCKICNEKGLDSQNYQCKDCGRPVGIVYGVPRVCSYDGCYYCIECHVNDECLVPAKIIFNWDFKRYKVSKRCKAYLQSAEHRPLLTVSQLNPKLYDHVPELQECRTLRAELCCLRKYLFQCAHQIAEELKRKIWPNEFLYDDTDTYSVSALALVMGGQLASMLRKAIAFAKAHVYECVICRLKGFFCELCGSSKVIFPFETDTTVQCDKCHAVYHKACRRSATGCPKCARIRKRQGALGSEHERTAARAHASLY